MELLDWKLFALASAVFASLTAIFGKIGVTNLNSNVATFIRTTVILLFIGTLVTLRKEWRVSEDVTQRQIFFLILSGLATGASWLCYYRALQLGPASKVAPLDKLSVALTIVLAILFLGESLEWKTLVGGLLIAAGSVLLVL
jgi:bacterial/archaeal transporter family protein